MHRTLLIFLLILSFFITLKCRTLENIDYMKYAEIGREILELKDWIMMHENGDIYVDKPPLHFWNIALSYRLFGINPFAARFPSAFFACLTLVLLVIFSRKTLNEEIGLLSAFILASSYGFFFFSQRTRIGIEFSFFLSGSLLFFFLGILEDRWIYYALFWVFTGAAFLDKGPACFLNLLGVLPYWFFSEKKGLLKPSLKKFLTTFPFFLIVTLPWVISLIHHKDFWAYLEKLKRTKIVTRKAGFFYYFPEIVEKFAPGILFVPFILLSPPGLRDEKEKSLFWFLLLFCISYFAVLHFTHAKNHRYLLPMFPILSILVAWALYGTLKAGKYKKFITAIQKVFLTLGVLTTLPFPIVYFFLKKSLSLEPILLGAFGLLFLAASCKERKILAVFVTPILIYLYINSAQAIRNIKTSDYMRGYIAIKSAGFRAEDVAVYKSCGNLREVLSFYFNKLLPCLNKKEDLKKFKVIVSEEKHKNDLKVLGIKRFITIKNHKGEQDKNYIIGFRVLNCGIRHPY